jgi:hypothetical protein
VRTREELRNALCAELLRGDDHVSTTNTSTSTWIIAASLIAESIVTGRRVPNYNIGFEAGHMGFSVPEAVKHIVWRIEHRDFPGDVLGIVEGAKGAAL